MSVPITAGEAAILTVSDCRTVGGIAHGEALLTAAEPSWLSVRLLDELNLPLVDGNGQQMSCTTRTAAAPSAGGCFAWEGAALFLSVPESLNRPLHIGVAVGSAGRQHRWVGEATLGALELDVEVGATPCYSSTLRLRLTHSAGAEPLFVCLHCCVRALARPASPPPPQPPPLPELPWLKPPPADLDDLDDLDRRVRRCPNCNRLVEEWTPLGLALNGLAAAESCGECGWIIADGAPAAARAGRAAAPAAPPPPPPPPLVSVASVATVASLATAWPGGSPVKGGPSDECTVRFTLDAATGVATATIDRAGAPSEDDDEEEEEAAPVLRPAPSPRALIGGVGVPSVAALRRRLAEEQRREADELVGKLRAAGVAISPRAVEKALTSPRERTVASARRGLRSKKTPSSTEGAFFASNVGNAALVTIARQQRRGSGDVWEPSPLAQRRKSQVPGSWGRYLLPLPAQPTPSWHP